MEYKEQFKTVNWQRKRLEILQRDNFKCCLCDEDKSQIEVHHLIYFKNKQVWEYDNELLISLCSNCHKDFHNEFQKVFALITFEIIKNKIDLIKIDKFLKQNKPKNKFKIFSNLFKNLK